jgi:uroporphyrinogen-III decarboxylase
MNSSERMEAAINLKPVDRVPNAPFYEAPICTYFGSTFTAALLEDQAMADAHLTALDEFKFDWVMVGMGLIGGIIPEALNCKVSYPENVFPVIEQTTIRSMEDIDHIAEVDVYTNQPHGAVFKGRIHPEERTEGRGPHCLRIHIPFYHRHPAEGHQRNHGRHVR